VRKTDKEWTQIITPKRSILDFSLSSIIKHKDLLFSFVKRDLSSIYKQTILGPIWFIVSPLMTVLIMSLVFGRIANIPTDGVPKILFYLAGLTFWNYFSTNVNSISSTFQTNANLFGKVYFPRIIAPLSLLISNTFKFLIQLTLFLSIYLYFFLKTDLKSISQYIILLPLIILLLNMLAMGIGLFITSFSIKYKDLGLFMGFGMNMLFYITPIIYPISIVPKNLKWIIEYNPLTSLFEVLKLSFFSTGEFNPYSLVYSSISTLIVFTIGIIVFNKFQRNFADSI
jgi:lipopolysaccharide transport system permease protein